MEQLYNAYNRSLIKKYGIYFDKYNVISLKDNDLSLNKEDKIKILEISKSKKYIAVSFSNLKIYIFELIEAKHDNNDIFNINLISIFDVINNKDENNEVNLINFSYDEKNLSVLINNSTLNIYDIFTGEIIRTFNKEIIYFKNITDKNNLLIGTKDKKILISNENDNNSFILIFPKIINQPLINKECKGL